MSMRLVFMGTPAFSVPTLRRLAQDGHDIAAVYTQPPRAAGRRGLKPTPSPVETEARRLGLDVRSLSSFKRQPDEIQSLRALRADIGVVVAFGMLLPQEALDAQRHGCLNGHASLLPRWRGAAPVQRAVEAGDERTGMMVMRMEAGLDTGPVAVTREIPIGAGETAGDLHERLALLCAGAMSEALQRLEAGSTLAFETQAVLAARTGREPVYARKIDKSEMRIDFCGEARATAARINAFSPFPGAWTSVDLGAGPERVKLLRAVAEDGKGAPGLVLGDGLLVACGSGAVRLLALQRAGAKALGAGDFLRGSPLAAGTRIGHHAAL